MDLMNEASNRKYGDAFTYKQAYFSTGTKTPVLTPATKNGVSLTLSGTYNADIEITMSSQSDIEAGSAVWVAHLSGQTTNGLVVHLPHSQAFRIKVNSGAPTLTAYAS